MRRPGLQDLSAPMAGALLLLTSVVAAMLLAACGAPASAERSPGPGAVAPDAASKVPPPLPTVEIRNPVLDRDFADLDTIKVGSTYYAYATNAASMNILAATSADLRSWTFLGNVLPRAPRWASQSFGYNWAPEVSQFGDTYVMYFAARLPLGSGGIQCIALAISDRPEGPFTPTDRSNKEPFICQQAEGGSIDPAVSRDDDGQAYLLWKNDGNSQDGQTWIYIQRLAADGMSLQGQPVRLITASGRWEGAVVEAPTLWKHEGKYYLFYSANDYQARDYGVGYAVADHVEGPYVKAALNPILKTSIPAGVVGPGGQDIVLGPDGQTYLLFHAWRPQGYRGLDLAPLVWENGAPAVKLPPQAVAGQ